MLVFFPILVFKQIPGIYPQVPFNFKKKYSIFIQFAELYLVEFNELQELYTKIAQLEEENYKLRERCFSLDQKIQQSSHLCQFWTGFPNYGTFKALIDFLDEASQLKTNWRGQATVESRHFSEAYKSKPGPTSKIH